MRRPVTILLASLSLFLAIATEALAVPDPCYYHERTLRTAERFLLSAQNGLTREHERLDRTQNNVAFRLALLAGAIQEAQAWQQAVQSMYGGDVAGCAVSTIIFGMGNGGCFGGAVRRGVAAKARAQARVNTSIARYNSYAIYSQGLVQRQAQRVVLAQSLYNQRAAEYQNASAALGQCRSTATMTSTQFFAGFAAP